MKKKESNKKFNLKRFIVFIIISVLAIVSLFIGIFFYNLGKVSNNNESVSFEVLKGQNTYTVFENLKKKNLIKNVFCIKVYYKLIGGFNIDAGVYNFNERMGSIKILENFKNKKYSSGNEKSITFKEGITIPTVVSLVAKNTNNMEEDIYSLINDKEYLKTLIEQYWFLTDDILNDDIYYSLEGYLYPETYFVLEEADAKTIIETMLKQTDKVLTKYKYDIEKSKYSIHEILTLASIIEKESLTEEDRKGVSSVFYNRLSNGWSLGSDVTTYYGAKVNLYERDLYQSEINTINAYNTRVDAMAGKLPVSPICNPSESSIDAALNPIESEYYYFVSDKEGKIYFAKDYSEHSKIIQQLKNSGMWLTF